MITKIQSKTSRLYGSFLEKTEFVITFMVFAFKPCLDLGASFYFIEIGLVHLDPFLACKHSAFVWCIATGVVAFNSAKSLADDISFLVIGYDYGGYQ